VVAVNLKYAVPLKVPVQLNVRVVPAFAPTNTQRVSSLNTLALDAKYRG